MIRETPDAVVCDLDGVVYRGDVPIEGSAAAIERLRAAGLQLLFCTNNSRSTVAGYVEKLARIGIEAVPDEILTSAVVTAEELQQRGYPGKTAIVVGGEGIRAALGSVCISVKDDPAVTRSDLVVVGWDPDFTYDRLARAATAVREGAAFVATNTDATFPGADGLLPGAGSLVAAIATASGREAEAMGKPNAPMLDAIERRLQGSSRIAVVGDRPDTDLAGARVRGWTSVLVLSGVTRPDAVDRIDPAPDVVVPDLAAFADEVLR